MFGIKKNILKNLSDCPKARKLFQKNRNWFFSNTRGNRTKVAQKWFLKISIKMSEFLKVFSKNLTKNLLIYAQSWKTSISERFLRHQKQFPKVRNIFFRNTTSSQNLSRLLRCQSAIISNIYSWEQHPIKSDNYTFSITRHKNSLQICSGTLQKF